MSYSITGNAKTLWSPHDDPHEILIAAKGERYRAYREQWERTMSFETVTDLPTQLDFELNPSCNLKCPMCTWSAESSFGQGRKSWLPFDAYTKIIDEVAGGVMSINLNYVNEPLIRRDLPDFVAYAVDAGIPEVMFNSNGMLLSEKFSRQLIEAGLTKLSISLDAVTPETFDIMRPGGKFETVLQNVDTFMRVREEFGLAHPLLKVTFLMTSENEAELPEFIDTWKDVADLVSVQHPANPFDGELGRERAAFLSPGHRPTGDDGQGTDAGGEALKRCAMPFQRLTIRSNGDVLPCCTFRGVDLVVGNAFADGVRAVWMNDEMREMRRIHKAGRYYENDVCRACMDSWADEAPDENKWAQG